MPTWLKYALSAVISFGTVAGTVAASPTPDGKPVPQDVMYLAGATAALNALLNLRTQSPTKKEDLK